MRSRVFYRAQRTFGQDQSWYCGTSTETAASTRTAKSCLSRSRSAFVFGHAGRFRPPQSHVTILELKLLVGMVDRPRNGFRHRLGLLVSITPNGDYEPWRHW